MLGECERSEAEQQRYVTAVLSRAITHELLGKTILVPLTNSLYVPGKLSDPDHVIVDIGTGYYVQKVRPLWPKLAFSELKARLVIVDASTGRETLRGQGGIHPNEREHARGDDTKEKGEYELPHWDPATEDPSRDAGWPDRKALVSKLLFCC